MNEKTNDDKSTAPSTLNNTQEEKAKHALVLGVFGIIGGLLVPFVGVILSIGGIVKSYSILKTTQNSRAKTALILSIIGLVLSILGMGFNYL